MNKVLGLSGVVLAVALWPGMAAAGDGVGAAPATPQSASTAAPHEPNLVAMVNEQPITREDLGRECLEHYGAEVIESMVNKHLILGECKRQNVIVTALDVDKEIDRLARQFGVPTDQWLKMIQEERGIKAKQYGNDIIWPTLALRKLAGARLKVTEAELREEFERECGQAVRARIIVCRTLAEANSVRSAALAHPKDFGNLAKRYSIDTSSAAARGKIGPIRQHSAHPEIEQVAFAIHDGDISPVIQVGDQYVILQRECEFSQRDYRFEDAKSRLTELLRDRKLRKVAGGLFRELEKENPKTIVVGDPARQARMPGVAAVIGDRQITLQELADECIDRYGEEVLEGAINHRLLEQACKRQGIAITEQDMSAEIAEVAGANLTPKPDGSPDVATWLDMATRRRGISLEVYRHDQVWPSVALKKLAQGELAQQIVVTDDDLRKGFEANYGPRVRCHAIVLNNVRQAQRVWDLLRKNESGKPLAKYFGDMAEQYSIEPGSRKMRGEVPPIKKNGGQPLLEEEAFALKPGELSGIIQASDKMFIILLCDGRTEPVKGITFEKVRGELQQDVHDKKLRLAMAEYFEGIQDHAAIDNFLAHTSKQPKTAAQSHVPRDLLTSRPGPNRE